MTKGFWGPIALVAAIVCGTVIASGQSAEVKDLGVERDPMRVPLSSAWFAWFAATTFPPITDDWGGTDNWQRFRAESLLGASLAGQKKYAEAEALLLEGYEGMSVRKDRIAAPDWYHLDRAPRMACPTYQAWGKPVKSGSGEGNRSYARSRASGVIMGPTAAGFTHIKRRSRRRGDSRFFTPSGAVGHMTVHDGARCACFPMLASA